MRHKLRARRAFLVASGRKVRKPRAVPRQADPKAGQLAYQKIVKQMREAFAELIRTRLYPLLPAMLEQANRELNGVRSDAISDDILRVFGNLAITFGSIYPESRVAENMADVGQKIDGTSLKEHRKQMKAALGMEVIVSEPFRQNAILGFIADNQALVTSLFDAEFEAFRAITSKGVRAGLRVESIQEELEQKLDITKSKASLLARDQTLKFYGQMTELRQRNIGVEKYTWSTSKDERVRPWHAELEGTEQEWAKPPVVDAKGRTAHPGQDYQCRCVPIPLIPEDFLT